MAVVLTPSMSWLVQSGSIFGAGLDVTDPDPADPDNPLLDMENVTVLPHMACAATTLPALGTLGKHVPC